MPYFKSTYKYPEFDLFTFLINVSLIAQLDLLVYNKFINKWTSELFISVGLN